MKLRTTPLKNPSGPRYWTAPGNKGQLVQFKAPYDGVGHELVKYIGTISSELPQELGTKDRAVAMLPLAGLVIGACWADTELELDTPFPLDQLDDLSALGAYGATVADELQDEGYDLLDIRNLFSAVSPELTRRQSIISMAQARASFSAAPEGASTVS